MSHLQKTMAAVEEPDYETKIETARLKLLFACQDEREAEKAHARAKSARVEAASQYVSLLTAHPDVERREILTASVSAIHSLGVFLH